MPFGDITRTMRPSELIEFILNAAREPLTALEVTNIYAELTDRPAKYVNVKYTLNQLVNKRKIAARKESGPERKIRANGREILGPSSMLYWSQGKVVPQRQTAVLVDGVELGSSVQPAVGYWADGKKPIKKSKSKKKRSGLPRASKVQTGTVSEMLEQIISERTREMQARINELEKKLTDIKKIIS